jgi:hypothetical protein
MKCIFSRALREPAGQSAHLPTLNMHFLNVKATLDNCSLSAKFFSHVYILFAGITTREASSTRSMASASSTSLLKSRKTLLKSIAQMLDDIVATSFLLIHLFCVTSVNSRSRGWLNWTDIAQSELISCDIARDVCDGHPRWCVGRVGHHFTVGLSASRPCSTSVVSITADKKEEESETSAAYVERGLHPALRRDTLAAREISPDELPSENSSNLKRKS